LLVFGRLADMWGGYPVYIGGLAWLFIWSLIAGFAKNEIMMDVCRALQGLGSAAFLPSGLMLLGSIYRPGPRKNLIFSIYGACAPVGFFTGIFFSGLTGEYLRWGWYFWVGAVLVFITTVVAYFAVPSDMSERGQGVKMDWSGSVLIISGLIMLVFAITDSAHALHGWQTPYVFVLFIVGALLLCAAMFIEGWVAEQPLLPFDLFKIKMMPALIASLFMQYGTLGIFLLYSTF
jgi:MFS family permease